MDDSQSIRGRVEVMIRGTAALLILAGSLALANAAHADLKLCNKTQSRVGVALGYKDKDGWASEGWWNVGAGGCETLLKGPLIARFYYVFAVDYDKGGSWGGKSMMCTRNKIFTIRGIENCTDRGFEKTGFFEVDTTEEVDWTISLSGEKTTAGP